MRNGALPEPVLALASRLGRPRATDTGGILAGLVVHSAGMHDLDAAPMALKSILKRWPWLRHIFADGGYAGPKLNGALKKVGKFTPAECSNHFTNTGYGSVLIASAFHGNADTH